MSYGSQQKIAMAVVCLSVDAILMSTPHSVISASLCPQVQ